MSKKKGSEDKVSSAVLDYLNKQNRPYSAIDIFNNLHKEHGKTAVVKALETLSSNGKIKEKVYGKQKVYAPNQDQFEDYDENEIKKLDQQVSELQEKSKMLQTKFKAVDAELRTLKSSLTTEDAQARLTELNQQCHSYEERLQTIKSATNHVTPEEKEQIYRNHKENVKHWRKRKRLATDILNCILEGYPKSKKQLIEETGIETDEEYSVVVPNI